MYRILISGYYGFNNIGDESILTAVIGSLREKLPDIDITVLSQNPESTSSKYGVKAVNRKSVPAIIKAVKNCDLLISGGGSLLQDVTSRKSILYYLFIMKMAKIMRKKYFIYSQGIGPIVSEFNERLTAKVLKSASGIVVRDVQSKNLLVRIGLPAEKVVVTADPVLRIKPVGRDRGKTILEEEGLLCNSGRPLIGLAVKERNLDSGFLEEICISAERLITERNCNILLIPFHYNEDMATIEYVEDYLKEKGHSDNVCAIKHKYLTDEMMSIIGNVDLLVGVRLHALIHAAIMGVPMIGISYDPKINSFLRSVGMKAMCSVYDFQNEFFIEEFDKTWDKRDVQKELVSSHVNELIDKLNTNEEMIRAIMEKR
ncbi:MAG: polysaccharide pyruvyl transferase CsaB [Firmicutes bacterium]|nr:polysaccharide pyruvyl transferase CsaB [Bacillota bacterium]